MNNGCVQAETRKQKRLRLDLPVYIHLMEKLSNLKSNSEGVLYDLSSGGCAFHHAEEIPIGTRVQLRIKLDDRLQKKFKKPELTATGAICRIERHKKEYILSVRFFR